MEVVETVTERPNLSAVKRINRPGVVERKRKRLSSASVLSPEPVVDNDPWPEKVPDEKPSEPEAVSPAKASLLSQPGRQTSTPKEGEDVTILNQHNQEEEAGTTAGAPLFDTSPQTGSKTSPTAAVPAPLKRPLHPRKAFPGSFDGAVAAAAARSSARRRERSASEKANEEDKHVLPKTDEALRRVREESKERERARQESKNRESAAQSETSVTRGHVPDADKKIETEKTEDIKAKGTDTSTSTNESSSWPYVLSLCVFVAVSGGLWRYFTLPVPKKNCLGW